MRNGHTCTSCKSGFVFSIGNAASRSRQCKPSQKTPLIICANLDVGLTPTTSSESTLCTKAVTAQQKNKVAKPAADAREHYPAVEGFAGFAVALCWVHKEVIFPTSGMLAALAPGFTPLCSQRTCDENLVCNVHKTVTCEKVCKLISWGSGGHLDYDSCDATLCDGTHGATACSHTAMMA